ncbi:MAG: hypothetical protein IJG70_09885 [Kiritimatiellae bacterium]|nr:hypothetical protein [Kiritimatiellia bacterium]
MKKPDMLLTDIERSIFAKALVISIIAHAVLLGGTSFSLFADWGKYGVHSPSYINAQKSKENKEAEAARRKAAAEEKAAEEAKKAESEKSAAAAKDAKAAAPAATNAANAAKPATAATPAAEDGKVTPPEVEPLPPKKEFQLGDDLSLD